MTFKQLVEEAKLPKGFTVRVSDKVIHFYYNDREFFRIITSITDSDELKNIKSLNKKAPLNGSCILGYCVTSEKSVKFKARFSDLFQFNKGGYKINEGLLGKALDSAVLKTLSIVKDKKYDEEQYRDLMQELNQSGLDLKLMKLYCLRGVMYGQI